MTEFPKELADGTVAQADYRELMERHINRWSVKAYVAKEPVRYIGLQVVELKSDSTQNRIMTHEQTSAAF